MINQSTEEFYTNLENQFPKVKDLELLNGIDIEEDGFENCGLMTSLAKTLTQYAKENDNKNVSKFLNMVEEAFETANDTIQNYLYTDFLVTIMEQKKEERELIKSLMGSKTKLRYKKLRTFYRELDK